VSRERVAFELEANLGVLTYLAEPRRLARSVSAAKDRRECAPEDIEDVYLTLGAHPDLVERFWNELPMRLSEDCRWIVYGTPALVHPKTGVVFGFGGGTHTYALRLAPAMRRAASADGAVTSCDYPAYPDLGTSASRLDLAAIGPEWIFGGWHRGEQDWCLSAYEFAGDV